MSQPRQKPFESHDVPNAAIHVGDVTFVNFVDTKIDDEQKVQRIAEHLRAFVENEGKKKILLNFSKVEYVGEVGIGMLAIFHKRVLQASARLVLYGVNEQVFEKFETVKLTRLLTIVHDEQAALFEMAKPQAEPSFEDQKKMACAKYLGIPLEKISKVETIQDGSGHATGLRVISEINTGRLDHWVRDQLKE
ncbi:MAG: STAS domain-containing protein [bacterium]|nr:STAS domain-containing protein [bacterium]